MSTDQRLELAIDLARRAGALLHDGFGHAADIRHKGTIDLVTEYDLRSEKLIVDGIRQAFPQDAWLAEEGGLRGSGDTRWLIDPLDGTVNFAHGVPIFAVSIAFARAGEPVMGVIYDPLRDELYHAVGGAGAFLNGRRLAVAHPAGLNDSLLVTGFAYDIRTSNDNNLDHYAAFALRSLGVRRLGAASLDLAYVAAGRFDGYWELSVEAWDVAAGVILVREAGGMATRCDGGGDILVPPISAVAAEPRLHAEMLAVLRETSRESRG